jgi:hypothetical protein
MPSNSLTRWRGKGIDALDEIEAAHARVGGTERGRRYATQQINYSYAVLLSSQFQRFCRDLHSECIDHIVAAVPMAFQGFLRAEFLLNRNLDRGNPRPSALGADFNRLGIDFWTEVNNLDNRNGRRQQLLEQLVNWRNAIGHQDFGPVGGNSTLHLARVQRWRRAVNALAVQFDRATYNYLQALLGHAPW